MHCGIATSELRAQSRVCCRKSYRLCLKVSCIEPSIVTGFTVLDYLEQQLFVHARFVAQHRITTISVVVGTPFDLQLWDKPSALDQGLWCSTRCFFLLLLLTFVVVLCCVVLGRGAPTYPRDIAAEQVRSALLVA